MSLLSNPRRMVYKFVTETLYESSLPYDEFTKRLYHETSGGPDSKLSWATCRNGGG